MQKFKSRVVLFLLVALAGPIEHLKADVHLPTNLAPGTQYQIIFVTADKIDGGHDNVDYYNSFANEEAALNPALLALGVEWHAVVSTDLVDARDNAPTSNITVYDTSGRSGFQGIYNGSADATLYDQYGNHIAEFSLAWTGSNAYGTEYSDSSGLLYGLGDYHANQTHQVGPRMGEMQNNGIPPGLLLNWGSLNDNNSLFPIYALSSPITVVPEPSSILLAALAFLGIAALRRRSR